MIGNRLYDIASEFGEYDVDDPIGKPDRAAKSPEVGISQDVEIYLVSPSDSANVWSYPS